MAWDFLRPLWSRRGSVRSRSGGPMPNANHYLQQANVVLSLSLGTSNPIVAAKLREIAGEYLARAVKLRVDRGLPPFPQSAALPGRPPERRPQSQGPR